MNHFLDILPGIIWAGFLGLAIGNFATNPIYRLPRVEPLFARDPYCGSCNALLKPRDLFPVLSWLMTKGKCRYCGASIPAAYMVTEALSGVIFVLCYLKYGFSEPFVLLAFGGVALLMLAMMLSIDCFFSDRTLIAAMVAGMLYRTLLDKTIYGFAGGAFAGLIVGALAWKCSGKPMVRDMAWFPAYLKLLMLAGIWLYPLYFAVLLIAILPAALLRHSLKGKTEILITALVLLLSLYA